MLEWNKEELGLASALPSNGRGEDLEQEKNRKRFQKGAAIFCREKKNKSSLPEEGGG